MKILCPVDFSDSSVNAVDYALNLFQGQELEVNLVHCFNLASRSAMFLKMDEILHSRAEEDLETFIGKLSGKYPGVNFSTAIYKGDPKYIIPAYESKRDFDFIVIGTTGMSEVKDLLVGSLTETLFEKSNTPVIAVPKATVAVLPKKLLLALDNKPIDSHKVLDPIKLLVENAHAQLHVCHVEDASGDDDFDPMKYKELDDFPYEYRLLKESDDGLSKTISQYAADINADILALVHRHRTWWQRLFTKSLSKEELYHLDTVLLVLNGD